MDGTKPYKFMGFGAMDGTKLYKFIRFGAMDGTKPYKFIRFGARITSDCLQVPSGEQTRPDERSCPTVLSDLAVPCWGPWMSPNPIDL